MKNKNTIHAFLLHYGMSTVLLLMLVAILVMLNRVNINQKVTADILEEGKGIYKAYVVKNNYLTLEKNTLNIDAISGETLAFSIQTVKEEPDYYVIKIVPKEEHVVKRAFQGNTKLTGFLYTHKVKLWNLVFSKIYSNKNTLW